MYKHYCPLTDEDANIMAKLPLNTALEYQLAAQRAILPFGKATMRVHRLLELWTYNPDHPEAVY